MNFNRKKITIPLLIITSLLIWSRNIVLLFEDPAAEDEAGLDIDLDTVLLMADADTSLQNTRPYPYSDAYRDPFKPWLDNTEKPQPGLQRRPPAGQVRLPSPIPPRLRYSGVIQNEKGMLAVIEDMAGTVHYIHRGDTVGPVRILKIEQDSLHCQWDTTFYRIPMQF